MYTAYFGFKLPPFGVAPDTRRFFGGCGRSEILYALRLAIGSGDGIVKVTGEVGTGKTLLYRMLQETLPESVTPVCLDDPRLDADEVVAALLMALGLPVAAGGRLQQYRELRDYLGEQHAAGRRVVVFVEEAQYLSVATLESLRLLTNLENGCDGVLQLILLGQPELDDLLARPELRQVRDRITRSFELRALDRNGVADYLRFRLYSAGYLGDELFSAGAVHRLAQASGGLIRRVHVLADSALQAAQAERSRRVESRHVQCAVRQSDGGSANAGIRIHYGAALVAGLALLTFAALQPWHGNTGNDPDPASPTSATAIEQFAAIHPAAGGSYVARRLSATSAWLADGAEGGLTIQVLLTEDDDQRKLESLLRRDDLRPLLDDLYVQETSVAGRKRFSVLYGRFGDKTEAYRALAELPDILQLHKPYLRSLNAIRASTESAERQG